MIKSTLFLFTTTKDLSAELISHEAIKRKINCQTIYYEKVKILHGIIYYEETVLDISTNDKIIIRWPWDAANTNIEYNEIVKKLITDYYNQIVLDKECLKNFTPDYEDKLFQSDFFNKHQISTPHTQHFSTTDKIPSSLEFPIVIKKRISSRSKGNFLVHDNSELTEKLSQINVDEYIFQEAINAVSDYRVMVLKDKVIGVVNRFMHRREDNRLSVKGMEKVDSLSPEIERDALALTKHLGADFVGCDVLITEKGKYYFIEANLSPQFNVFTKTTDINVAGLLIEVTALVL